MRKYLWLAPVALLLAGCSKHGAAPIASAHSPTTSPEPVEQAAAAAEPTLSPAEPAPVAATSAVYTSPAIPAGTPLEVRLDESVGTKHDRAGERFSATLAAPIVMGGRIVLPAGTRFTGHLTESKPSGRLKGRAVIAVRLDSVHWHGRPYPIQTSSIARTSRSHKGHNLRWIGGFAGFGAAVGGIAAGGAGALIGAGAGAGAGTAGAAITGKKQVGMRAETRLTFRLREPVQL